MTAQVLSRICRQHGRTPQGWHLQLAEEIPPLAVFHIFMQAEVRPANLFFSSPDLADRAMRFMDAANRVFERSMGVLYAKFHYDTHGKPPAPMETEEQNKRANAARRARYKKAKAEAARAIEERKASMKNKVKVVTRAFN